MTHEKILLYRCENGKGWSMTGCHMEISNEVRTRKRLVNEWDGCQAKSRQTTFSTQSLSSHYQWPTPQVINKFWFYFPRENKLNVSIPAPLKKKPILVTGQTIDPKREVQQDFFHFYASPTSCVPVTWAEATKLVSPLRSHQASWHSSTGTRISNLRNVFPMVKVSSKI